MLKKLCRLVLALALILLAAPLAAPAQGPPPPPAKWWLMPRVVRELGITAQEQSRLDELFLQMRTRRIQLRSQKDQARLMIDSYLERQPLDQEALEKEFQKLARAQADISLAQSRFLLEVRKLLGPDRFRRLRALFDRYRQQRGFGPGQGRRPRPYGGR